MAPVSSYGTGITSNVASPDEAARALQTAFQPMGYAGGGQVINGVKHFEGGGENVSKGRSFLGGMFRLPAPDQMLVPKRYTPVMQDLEDKALTPSEIEDQQLGEAMTQSQFSKDMDAYLKKKEPTEAQRAAAEPSRQAILGPRRLGENIEAGRSVAAQAQAEAPPRPGILDYFTKPAEQRRADIARTAQSDAETLAKIREAQPNPPPRAGIPSIPVPPPAAPPAAEKPPAAAAPTVPPPADKTGAAGGEKKVDEESGLGKRLSLRIDELKQEREANKAQQKENQLLALMQAGFQAAAGKSSNALSNIAAGGAAGIATLADLEKTRRAEDASLRKEGLELELAKEKMIESGAERRSQREMLAAQRQQSLLQSVTVNTRQEVSGINSTIASEEAKIANGMGLTEEQKAPIRAEIARLKDQRRAAEQQMYDVYAQMGLTRPKTPEQSGMPPAGSKIIPLPGGAK
jgi:hypothetical protein